MEGFDVWVIEKFEGVLQASLAKGTLRIMINFMAKLKPST